MSLSFEAIELDISCCQRNGGCDGRAAWIASRWETEMALCDECKRDAQTRPNCANIVWRLISDEDAN